MKKDTRDDLTCCKLLSKIETMYLEIKLKKNLVSLMCLEVKMQKAKNN